MNKKLILPLCLILALLMLVPALPAPASAEGAGTAAAAEDAAHADEAPAYRVAASTVLLAVLFFLLIALLAGGVLCAVIVPAVKRKRALGDSSAGRRTPKSGYRRFWAIWAAIYIFFSVAALIGMTVLNRVLTEYESAQPGYEAERIFERYFGKLDTDVLWPYVEYTAGPYETGDDAKAYLKELIAGNGGRAEYREVISDSAGTYKYAVYVGNYSLGYFTVKDDPGRVSERFGFNYKKLDEIKIRIKPLYGITVFAPLKAGVRINGVEVRDEAAAGEPVVMADAPYFPEGDGSYRTMVNYSVSGLYRFPEIKVFSENAVSYVLEYDAQKDGYVTRLGPSGGPVVYTLVYDMENGTCSAEADYVRKLAAAYTLASEAEQKRQYEENLAAVRKALSERKEAAEARIAAEEAARIKAIEDYRISEEIRPLYESRVQTLVTEYTRFMYRKPTKSYRSAFLKYLQSGTELYSFIKNYTNLSWFTPSKYTFSEFSSSEYSWTDDSRTAVRCRVHLHVEMYGYSSQTKTNITTSEDFDAFITISFTQDGKGLIYSVSNIEQ